MCINKPFHSCKMKVFYVFLILRCFWKNWSTKFKSQEQVFVMIIGISSLIYPHSLDKGLESDPL